MASREDHMESLMRDHWEAVLAVLAALWAAFVALTGVVFGLLTKRHEAQAKRVGQEMGQHGERITRIEDDVGDLRVAIADGKRDRQGLHYEIAQGFRGVGEKLDLYAKSNAAEHEGIFRLIKHNGGK